MALKYDENNVPYIDLGRDIRLSLDFTEYGDKKSEEKAREELRETPEIVENGLKELRELLANDGELKVPTDNDAFLKKFLRPRKYYAESAYELMKTYHKMKAKKDFVLDNMSAAAVRVALEERVVQLFPHRDSHGRRIIYLEMGGKWDCSKVSYPELIRATHTILTIVSLEPLTQLNGIVYIVNFDKMKLSQLAQFNPKFVKNTIDYGQKGASVRIKEMNLINTSKVFDLMFKIFKPFINQKWSKRLKFIGSDLAALHGNINEDCLPTWLGGSLDVSQFDGKILADYLAHYQDKFDELNSYGYVKKDAEIN